MNSNNWHSTKDTYTACNCMGRQNGEPFCPCEMRARGVRKCNGRWVEPPVARPKKFIPTEIQDKKGDEK